MIDPDQLRDDDLAALEGRLRRAAAYGAPTEAMLQRAFDVFPARCPRLAPGPGMLQRLLQAVLQFDSLSGAAPAAGLALRAERPRSRRLVFGVDGVEVEIRVQPGEMPQTWALAGQVLAPAPHGRVLLQTAVGQREALLSADAEFRFDGLRAGILTLTIQAADWTLQIPPFSIDEAA